MKHLRLLALTLLLCTLGFAQEDKDPDQLINDTDVASYIPDVQDMMVMRAHGGRNGGDGIEAEIRLMAKKIESFLVSEKGRNVFPEINMEHLKRVMKVARFYVTDEVLIDRFGTKRTCTNNPNKMDVFCNVNLWGLVKQPAVYYVLILHEILGLMNLELGHNKNVSMYPISSRLIGYIEDVENSELAVKTLTPEFYSLDRLSLGTEIRNHKKENKAESIRLICFDDVEIHHCGNFVFVRKFKGRQAPVVKGLEPLSDDELRTLQRSLVEYKRKAHVRKYMVEIVDILLESLNVNKSLHIMGIKKVMKKKYFKGLEDLLNLELFKIKTEQIKKKGDKK